jgi:hypothetical protein
MPVIIFVFIGMLQIPSNTYVSRYVKAYRTEAMGVPQFSSQRRNCSSEARGGLLSLFCSVGFVVLGISIVFIGLDAWADIHPGCLFGSIFYFTEDIQLITYYSEPSYIKSLIVVAARVYASADTSKTLALEENKGKSGVYR